MRKFGFSILIVLFLAVPVFSQTASAVCPATLGLEFPADVREASIMFEKACAESQQKFTDLKAATEKAKEELSRTLASNSSFLQLFSAYGNYLVTNSEEMVEFSRFGRLVTSVAFKWLDFGISQRKQGRDNDPILARKYGVWQSAALEVSRIRTRDDKELLAQVHEELNRRNATEREEFRKMLEELNRPIFVPK